MSLIGLIPSVVLPVVGFVLMFLLEIRWERKKIKELEERLSNLENRYAK
jgi:preprotein translocase subunit YajC